MSRPTAEATDLRLAITADLHWGIYESGDAATRQLAAFLRRQPPDVLVLAGDIGAGDDFGRCLGLFAELPCRKALVPGNHDIWVTSTDARGDSLQVYREHLPRLCARHGFHYLDAGPLLLGSELALVGTINWYDYSWSLDALRERLPDWAERLQSKRFSRGRHNDARYVRWPLDDRRFTAEVVAQCERHLVAALASCRRAVVVTHHPAFQGLSFPRPEAESFSPDALLWEAFSGNRALEALLARHADRIAAVFSGHTHRERENRLGSIPGWNVGGDYHFKRLLWLDWPAGQVEAHIFGEPKRP
ncbi:MAG: metallophosphoesterase [Gemmataceae bacterium]|nr:metallophosphoesterase [Gemmataceae bacterium]MDW8266873.1 metallophosphoesterase [Gemmataceae bacterium]